MTDPWVGIDVAKYELVVGILPRATWAVPNDASGAAGEARRAGPDLECARGHRRV